MGNFGGIAIGAIAVVLGVFYQFALKDFLYLTGITREVQRIEEFPYECRRLKHELLEGCEDMWLDHNGRKLYAACADIDGRTAWTPYYPKTSLNVTARKGTDHFSVLDIDEPGADGLFGLRTLEISGDYRGVKGSKELDLHGFDVELVGDSRLRFWIINHRPPFDFASNQVLDAFQHGANSTIEVFEHTKGSSSLEFIKTIYDPVISTPNDLALLTSDGGGFLVTNDHSSKVGWRRELDMLLGGGSIAYHSPKGNSIIKPRSDPATDTPPSKFYAPNGIVRGKNGVFYMADSATGKVSVLNLYPSENDSEQPILYQVDSIDLKYPIDNLSVDSEGTIWAAVFPKTMDMIKEGTSPPRTFDGASAVISIKKVEGGKGDKGWKGDYVVEKVLEDGEGKVLPMSTVAVHDAASGRIFLGGIRSGFITVCDKRK